MNMNRRMVPRAAEALRDLTIECAWKLASIIQRRDDPDGDEFGQFLRQAGDATDPDRDEAMMPYWLVSRRMPGPRMPEALQSAYFRFRGRRRRDPERARLWRSYVLSWAELQARAEEADLEQTPRFDDPVPPAPIERTRPDAGRLYRVVAALAVVTAVGLGLWVTPSIHPSSDEPLPSVSALGIEQLERGSRSLVEQALRARYIETLDQVQRLSISSVGDGSGFERVLLEGARLDVERAIKRHRRTGRVPTELYLLFGKLSLLTEFETEGRRALARAANRGGPAAVEARELLELLPE